MVATCMDDDLEWGIELVLYVCGGESRDRRSLKSHGETGVAVVAPV